MMSSVVSQSPSRDGKRHVYVEQIKALQALGTTTVYIDYTDLLETDTVTADAIGAQYYR